MAKRLTPARFRGLKDFIVASILPTDTRITKDCKTPMTEIDAAYRSVLEQLPAHDIKEIEGFD